MDNEKTGGPAYPETKNNGFGYEYTVAGNLTVLDHFAGLSNAHMADGSGYSKEFIEAHMGRPMPSWRDPEHITYTAAFNAKMKYADAAAMIAERNRLMNENR